MFDKWKTRKIIEDIAEELNIHINIIAKPNCTELVLKEEFSVDDVPFDISKGCTFIKIFGASIIIVSALGEWIEETDNIDITAILSVLEQCEIMNKIYGKDKGNCYFDTNIEKEEDTDFEIYRYRLKVDTPRFLDNLSEKDFKEALKDNLETVKKLSVSAKGVIYTYTGYEDN